MKINEEASMYQFVYFSFRRAYVTLCKLRTQSIMIKKYNENYFFDYDYDCDCDCDCSAREKHIFFDDRYKDA